MTLFLFALTAVKNPLIKEGEEDQKSSVHMNVRQDINHFIDLYQLLMFVNAVRRSFIKSQERNLNSVQESATSIFAMEVKEYKIQIHRFKTAQKLAISLHEEGALSDDEYSKIIARLKKKYGIKNKSVFID